MKLSVFMFKLYLNFDLVKFDINQKEMIFYLTGDTREIIVSNIIIIQFQDCLRVSLSSARVLKGCKH